MIVSNSKRTEQSGKGRKQGQKSFSDINTHSTVENRGLKGRRDRTPPRKQLQLFDEKRSNTTRSVQSKPLLAIYATQSVCKCPGSGRWWNIRCSYNGKMFGGLYSVTERDIILKGFEGRTTPVELNEFEAAAKYAMKAAVRRAA